VNHFSYNQFHLGDNLIHLHFLRHLALKYPAHTFIHAVKEGALATLSDCIEDVKNVSLVGLEEMERNPDRRWINSWKNAGCEMGPDVPFTPGFWDTHPRRNDFSGFYLELFGILSREMGLESSFEKPSDLWFDYPKIREGRNVAKILSDVSDGRPGESTFDFLVVNSVPLSGQIRAFRRDPDHLTPLIEELAQTYRVIVTHPVNRAPDGAPILCTQDYGLSLTDIGTLSLHCPYLLMVSTGPSWTTFNVWNRQTVKLRVILLDVEQLNLGGNTVQVSTRQAARTVLVEHGLLPQEHSCPFLIPSGPLGGSEYTPALADLRQTGMSAPPQTGMSAPPGGLPQSSGTH
jgi:hypothetical protein